MSEPASVPPAAPAPDGPPAPVPVTRLQMLVQLLSAGLLLGLYGVDLSDALRLPGAELAAFVTPPSAVFAAGVVLAALGACAAAGYGYANTLGGQFKGHRLLPITLVVVLFVDLFVVTSARPLMSASEQVVLAVHEFARRAVGQTTAKKVTIDEAALRPLVEELGLPPYWVKGERVKGYSIEVRPTCDGPVSERGNSPPGTLLYCANAARTEAWVTLVGLPTGTRFGTPEVVKRGELLIAAEVKAAWAELPERPEQAEQPPGDGMEPPQQMPGTRWGELEDAGMLEPESPGMYDGLVAAPEATDAGQAP